MPSRFINELQKNLIDFNDSSYFSESKYMEEFIDDNQSGEDGYQIYDEGESFIDSNKDGEWKTLTDIKNSSSDVSCVAGQMPRIIGLAYASKLYRNNNDLDYNHDFLDK